MRLPHILDSTILTTFRACPRKFMNSHVLHRGLRGVNIHLGAGGAFASGIEEYRQAYYVDGAKPDDCMDRARLATVLGWGDVEAFPADCKPDSEHLLHAKTLDRVMGAIEGYFVNYNPRFDRLQPLPQLRDGKASFEYSLAMPLDGPQFPLHPDGNPFIWHCRADTLGTYDTVPCFSDEKTTGAMGRSWASKWPLRNQFLGYAWVMRAMGRPERACLVRGICILKEKNKFAETFVRFPDYLLDAFERALIHDLNMMVFYAAQNVFPQRFGEACESFGNCLFHSVCLAPDFIHSEVLSTKYVEHVWDPSFRAVRSHLLTQLKEAA